MTNNYRITPLRTVAGALLVLAASALFTSARAEEANTPATPETTTKSATPSQTDADAENRQQPGAKVAKTPEEFTPSEEISEDYAVSFPVDI